MGSAVVIVPYAGAVGEAARLIDSAAAPLASVLEPAPAVERGGVAGVMAATLAVVAAPARSLAQADYDCPDFATHADAQAFYEAEGDTAGETFAG